MPAVNGVTPPTSPRPDTTAPSTKRKLDDFNFDTPANGENTANDRHNQLLIQRTLRDIWDVLNAQDTPPSILQSLASYQTANDPSDRPSTKRAKLSSSSLNNTIPSKIANGSYESYEAFNADVEAACAALLKSDHSEPDPVSGASTEHENLAASLATLKKFLATLVYREKQRTRSRPPSEPRIAKLEQDDDVKINGVSHLENAPVPASSAAQSSRTVLTLLGNAQGHKQLFSSFQKPISKTVKTKFLDGNDPGTFAPLREASLPMGISGTRIIPASKQDVAKNKKPRRTLHDVFAPPASVRSLVPPKTPKLVTSRESAITWSKGAAAEQPTRSTGYPNEKLSTGTWLGYGGLAPAEEPTSPQAKRKQRDRALSIGESSLAPSRVAKAAMLQAQEEALFRSAYSSFAPSRDNSAALIPEETRNEMWWEKYGVYYFNQAFAIDPALESQDDEHTAERQPEDKESIFQEAVDQFEPTPLPVIKTPSESEDKDAEEMLLEISQMLETLHSYQRIRMSSLSAGSRTSLVQHSPLQEFTGSPSTPSTAEVETYKTLKSQLALIVSMLPPFAVAKLNGDQLADLNISQEIPIEVEEYRGVMEEDKASRDAKQAAFQAAVGVATATNRQSPLQSAAQNQLRAAQMPHAARGHNQNHLQYNNNTPQTLPRAQPQFSRQPLSSWQKPNQNYNASIQRPAYANAQNFNQQLPRNVNQILRQQQPYTPMQHTGRPHNLPQLPNGAAQSVPQIPFQQRMQGQGSPTYNPTTNAAFGPSPSPSKNLQRNYQPQMQHQIQHQPMSMQQSAQSQMSPSQANVQLPQSPQQQQLQAQVNNTIQQSSTQQAQTQPQPPPLSLSPLPRPSSAAGLGITSANGDTDGAAVTSRSETPDTPAPVQSEPQLHVPPVANMTPIVQE